MAVTWTEGQDGAAGWAEEGETALTIAIDKILPEETRLFLDS